MDEIKLTAYDPDWPRRFEVEKARLLLYLTDPAPLRIEHIGSTAIPGLAAKPVIDIMIGVYGLSAVRARYPIELEVLGYAFWAENPRTDRLFLVRGLPPNGPRDFHVHVCQVGPEFDRHLVFRDHLRANPDDAAAYLALKTDLATRFRDDRDAYTRGKDDFVASIEAKAHGAQISSPSSL